MHEFAPNGTCFMGCACPVDNASAPTRWIPNSASWRGLRVAAPSRCLWEKVFDNPKNVPSADGGETFSGSKTHPNCFIKLVKSVQQLFGCNSVILMSAIKTRLQGWLTIFVQMPQFGRHPIEVVHCDPDSKGEAWTCGKDPTLLNRGGAATMWKHACASTRAICPKAFVMSRVLLRTSLGFPIVD